MRRGEFIALFGGVTAVGTLRVQAQPTGRTRQIVVWMGRANDAEGLRHAAAFREGLQALGWAEGRNIRTDYRWVTGDIDRSQLAKDVIDQQPDLIVVETTVAVAEFARQGSSIPVVFVNVSDPVGSGFVASLAKPGVPAAVRFGRFWQIVLQKSFCTSDQKFCGVRARFSCKDVGDLIAPR